MRLAFRSLCRAPGLALAIIATLTVAFAFTIATFGLLNGLLLHPYPYPKLRQLQLVRDSKPREGAHQGRSIAVADFLDARSSVGAFARLTAWRPQPMVITNPGADPERVEGAAATADFPTVLGIMPMLGRSFDADADTSGRDNVVLISRRLWSSRFGASPATLGSEIHLNGRPARVIGIVRDEECYPPGVDAWVPLVFTAAERAERAAQRVNAIGRLADDRTTSDAIGQLTSLAQALATRFPATNRGRGFELIALQREQFEFTAPLFAFVQAAAFLVLLLAVVNVSTLLLARTLDRRRELVVRSMLGASAGRLAGLAVVEVLLPVAAGIACGALFAGGLLNGIRASLPEGIARWIAGWSSLRVDRTALASGISIGLLVTMSIAAVVAITSLRSASGSVVGVRETRRSTRGRRVLVAGEIGLAAALLLGASVMVAGFARIATAFEVLAPSRLLRFTLTLPESRYPDELKVASFHAAMLEKLRQLPEVANAALIRNGPASNVPNPLLTLQREDIPAMQPSDLPRADIEVVSPAAFEALRLDVLAGRALMNSDSSDTARVAAVSRTAVRRFWLDRDPLGSTIRLGNDPRPVRVVGIVSDLVLNWYDPESRPIVYLADAQSPARTTTAFLRTRIDPMSVARQVRAAIADLDDRQPIAELEALSATVSDSLSPIRVIERLLLVAATVASALAAIGVYGVFAHWVGARRREFGVRFALGATPASIARLVIHEATVTAGVGIVAGLAVATGAVRLAGGAFIGVLSLDLLTGLFVAVGAMVLALAAAFGPARRAGAVDVAELLRLD